MKSMTCKQLYGACDEPISGATPEEMMENSKKHGMEMVAKGDKPHMDAIEEMMKHGQEPGAYEKFMEEFRAKFATQAED